MRMKLILIVMVVFFVAGVSALDTDNWQRLNFGHVIVVDGLETEPATIEPGVAAILRAEISNQGNEFTKDIRAELKLPDEIGMFNDVSQKKIFKLVSEGSGVMEFSIIALPGISEGIYVANLSVDYINHIGEERNDEYKISIIVKSKPKMYVQIEESDVYRGKKLGEISVKFVNNNVADIKFSGILAKSRKAALKEVVGVCNAMGVKVNGEEPDKASKLIGEGKWDKLIPAK